MIRGCWRSRAGDEPIQDQAEKKSAGRPVVPPAQVLPAGRAHRHPPGRAGKPGKCRAGRARGRNPRRGGETADLEDPAIRIGEDVVMRAGHRDALALLGDGGPAGGAAQGRREVSRHGAPVRAGGSSRSGRPVRSLSRPSLRAAGRIYIRVPVVIE